MLWRKKAPESGCTSPELMWGEVNSTGIMISPPLESYKKSTTDWRFSPQVGLVTFMSLCYITRRCKFFFFLKAAQEKSVKGKKKGLMLAPSQMSRANKTYKAPVLLRSERCLWSYSFSVLNDHIRVFRLENESCFCQKSITVRIPLFLSASSFISFPS